MKPYILLSVIISGLIISGFVSRNGSFLLLTIPLWLYLMVNLWESWSLDTLTVQRDLSTTRILPAETVTVTLHLTNHGSPLSAVHVADSLPPSLEIVHGSPAVISNIATGQTIQLSYTLRGQRGLYRFRGVRLTRWSRLGLFEQSQDIAAPAQCLVLPELTRLKQFGIRPRRTGVYAGVIPTRRGGAGVEFFGVREYQAGDPQRWLNHRLTARHEQKLFVNQFQQERMADIGLILDARQQSDVYTERGSLFEYNVQAIATLSDTLLSQGNRVGLFIYGRTLDWTVMGYGKKQKERIMQALARAELGSGAVFERLNYLPIQLFPPQSQLIFVSPLLSHDADSLIPLRARGYQLLVISPNPITFEQESMAHNAQVELATRMAHLERELLLRKLRQARIRVVDWSVEQPFQQVIATLA